MLSVVSERGLIVAVERGLIGFRWGGMRDVTSINTTVRSFRSRNQSTLNSRRIEQPSHPRYR